MSERHGIESAARDDAPAWWDQSGKNSIRGIIALLIIVLMVYLGMKFIPVQAAAFQFDDAVRDEVVFAGGRRGGRRATDDVIKRNLVQRAATLGLPVGNDDIKITRPGRKYIVIEVEYSVTLEFVGGYTYERTFTPKHEGPIIF